MPGLAKTLYKPLPPRGLAPSPINAGHQTSHPLQGNREEEHFAPIYWESIGHWQPLSLSQQAIRHSKSKPAAKILQDPVLLLSLHVQCLAQQDLASETKP